MAKDRCGLLFICAEARYRAGVCTEALRGRANGARKSKYSGCEATCKAATLLCALTNCDATFGGAVVFVPAALLAARQHDVHMVDADDIIVVSKSSGKMSEVEGS